MIESMLLDVTLTKNIICNLNQTTKKDLLLILKKKYTSFVIDDYYILEIKNINHIEPGRMYESVVNYKVTFSCMAYKANIGEVVNVRVLNTSHMGTYCYDDCVGKEVASFYLPSLQITESHINVKVIGKRLYDGLLYLVQLEEDPRIVDQNKEDGL